MPTCTLSITFFIRLIDPTCMVVSTTNSSSTCSPPNIHRVMMLTLRFLSLLSSPLILHPPCHPLPLFLASLYDELIDEATQFITREYSRLLHFNSFTPPIDEHPDPTLYMRAKPLPNPASWQTIDPSRLPPLVTQLIYAHLLPPS